MSSSEMLKMVALNAEVAAGEATNITAGSGIMDE